jgi:hypothetical protein
MGNSARHVLRTMIGIIKTKISRNDARTCLERHANSNPDSGRMNVNPNSICNRESPLLFSPRCSRLSHFQPGGFTDVRRFFSAYSNSLDACTSSNLRSHMQNRLAELLLKIWCWSVYTARDLNSGKSKRPRVSYPNSIFNDTILQRCNGRRSATTTPPPHCSTLQNFSMQ